jgi:Fe-only nitrogenase accessory protein AnfO
MCLISDIREGISMDQIAVLLNKNSEIAALEDFTELVVFDKHEMEWLVVKSISTSIDFLQDLSSLRQNLQQLAMQLGDCKIIVGRTISGIGYRIFDKMGFDIFEIAAFIPAILDKIVLDVKNSLASNTDENSLLNNDSPVETNIPGIYFLDLIAVQKRNPQISSKKMLQPFLNKTPFVRLDIVCGHIPPWIEKLAEDKKFELEVEKLEQQNVKVSIMKTCCS